MLTTETIEIKWNSSNKKHFESLGYLFTKMKDTFIIEVDHLMKTSKYEIEYECDYIVVNLIQKNM